VSLTVTTKESVACTVCIANYNGIGLIDACIESVRSQTCDFPFEIIVHDDASSDGSVEHITAHFPDVRLIVSRENVGFCIANNRMAETARGEYLLLLNNDATLLPDALATLMHEALRLQQPAILTLPQYDAETGELLDVGSLLDPFLNPVPNRDAARNDVAMVAGACLWLPKRLWEELGGFPDWFGSIGEDLYLCCRARLAGHLVRALGVSGYRHCVGQSFGGGKAQGGRLVTTFRRRAMSERNKTFVMAVCYPAPLLMALLPLHLVLLLLEGAVLSLLRWERRPLTDIYLPVPAACWRERERLRRLRKEVQATRRTGVRAFLATFRFLPHKLSMLLRHGLPWLT
jgi:GT2 family glycosyltransferase